MPTVDIPNKRCSKCNEVRDILLFSMKDKKKRQSYCKFCVTSFPKSRYIYTNKEQQQIAEKNLKLLRNKLKRIKLGRNICICGNEKFLGKKKCNNCALEGKKQTLIKKRKRDDNNKRIQKRKQTRRIEHLKKTYVYHMIKASIRNTTGIIINEIPNDIIELKRKQLTLTRKIKNNG